MRRAVGALIALAGLCLAAGKPYSGTQCTGVVDFELQASTSISATDTTIMLMFSAMPKWLTEECQNAARTAQCGIQYAASAEAGSGMCKSQCQQILQPCSKPASLNDQLDFFVGPDTACAALSDVDCVEVGELDESLYAEAECPSPLVVTKAHPGKEYEGYVLRAPGTACAVPCPAGKVFYGEDKYKGLEILFFVASAVAVASGLTVLIGLQPKGTRLYAWMFTFCGTVAAAAALIYNCMGPRELLCDDEIGHRRRDAAMVTTAVIIHYFYLCAVTWLCLQALSVWLIIKSGTRRTKIERWQKYYLSLSLLLPAILCAFPASAHNYGWATQVFIPFPLMVFEDTQSYFWATMYTPMVLILVVQVTLTLDATWSFFKLYRQNRVGNRASGVTTTRTDSFLRFNREPLFLMFAIGVFTLLDAIGVGYSLVQAKSNVENGFKDYLQCLLEEAVPGEGGDCVASDFYFDYFFVGVVQCFYIVCYPIIALFAFGPSAFVWRRVAWLAGFLTSAPDSRQDYESDSKRSHTRLSTDRRRQQSGEIQMKSFKGGKPVSSVKQLSVSSPDDSMAPATSSMHIDDSVARSTGEDSSAFA